MANKSRLTPLLSVWLRPAQTVGHIAHENPGYRLLSLPIIAGFAVFPTVALFATEESQFETGFVLSSLLAFGPVRELLQVFVGAYLIRLTGIWLGGKAGVSGIQTAIVWGNVPIALLAVVGVVLLVVSSVYEEVFQSPLVWNQSLAVASIAWLLFVLQALIVGWSMVIFLRGLATVQGYSIGRATVNAVLAWSIPAVLIALATVVLGQSDMLTWIFFAGFENLVIIDES